MVFLILVFVFFSAVAFFYIPYLKIQKISIAGNSSLSTEKILIEVSSYLNSKTLFIFPRNNILILPKETISNNLLSQFPRIGEVSLEKNFPDSISVKIRERKQEALFCIDKECAFIDEDGFVFEKAPYFSGDVYLKFFNEREDVDVGNLVSDSSDRKLSFQLILQEQFKKLIEFKNLVPRENIKVSKVVLKKEEIYEIYTDEKWYILLNEKNDAKISYENLKITLDAKIKENRQKLEYIDLRFGNKVFYKFK